MTIVRINFKLTVWPYTWYIFLMMQMIFICVFFLFSIASASSYADIYKYVDENGVTYYTNVPQDKDYKKIITERKDTSTREYREYYDEVIHTKASEYGIEPSLVNAIITVESNWNYNALSNKGAMGLMQLMPSTAKDMAVSNPYNPEENIEGGIRYLRFLLDKFNDVPLALAAYNAGPRTVQEHGGIPAITETRQYVKKVLSIYQGNANNNLYSRRAQIYKVTLEDGTVLFTNTPFAYQNNRVSKF